MPRGDNADAASSAATVAATGSIRPEGQSFTWRGVLAGLGVGLVICFSNMYFGLQTGWIGTMSMPSSLMGFAIFRALGPLLRRSLPFSAVENVLVQTVAGSMAIMPLGCGFVGIVSFIFFPFFYFFFYLFSLLATSVQ